MVSSVSTNCTLDFNISDMGRIIAPIMTGRNHAYNTLMRYLCPMIEDRFKTKSSDYDLKHKPVLPVLHVTRLMNSIRVLSQYSLTVSSGSLMRRRHRAKSQPKALVEKYLFYC